MKNPAYREAAHAVAAHMLRRRFESVDLDGGLVAAQEFSFDIDDDERRQRSQDEATIATVACLVVDGATAETSDEWAHARAARLVRRYDFMPMLEEVAAALESRGSLTYGHVDDLVRSVRRRIDIAAMDDHLVLAAAAAV